MRRGLYIIGLALLLLGGCTFSDTANFKQFSSSPAGLTIEDFIPDSVEVAFSLNLQIPEQRANFFHFLDHYALATFAQNQTFRSLSNRFIIRLLYYNLDRNRLLSMLSHHRLSFFLEKETFLLSIQPDTTADKDYLWQTLNQSGFHDKDGILRNGRDQLFVTTLADLVVTSNNLDYLTAVRQRFTSGNRQGTLINSPAWQQALGYLSKPHLAYLYEAKNHRVWTLDWQESDLYLHILAQRSTPFSNGLRHEFPILEQPNLFFWFDGSGLSEVLSTLFNRPIADWWAGEKTISIANTHNFIPGLNLLWTNFAPAEEVGDKLYEWTNYQEFLNFIDPSKKGQSWITESTPSHTNIMIDVSRLLASQEKEISAYAKSLLLGNKWQLSSQTEDRTWRLTTAAEFPTTSPTIGDETFRDNLNTHAFPHTGYLYLNNTEFLKYLEYVEDVVNSLHPLTARQQKTLQKIQNLLQPVNTLTAWYDTQDNTLTGLIHLSFSWPATPVEK